MREIRDPAHILVVTGDTLADRDYQIEHPDDCPTACTWWPGAADVYKAKTEGRLDFFTDYGDGHHTCVVQYELDNVGLDCLFGEIDGVTYEGGTRYRDGKWISEGWREIPPGRYLIEGWAVDGGWIGSEPVDADGGIDLVGKVTEYVYVQGHRIPALDDDVELSDDEYDRRRNRACRACGRSPIAVGNVPSWDKHDACIANIPGVVFACCGHGTVTIDGWRDEDAIVRPSPVAGGTRIRYDGCYLVFDDGITLYGRAARAAMEMLGGDPPPEPEGEYTAGGVAASVIVPAALA